MHPYLTVGTCLSAIPRFWTPTYPYHTVGSNSRLFPAFGRQRTLITPLDPIPGVSPHLDAGAPLSHRWTRLQAFPRFLNTNTTLSQRWIHFPTYGRQRITSFPVRLVPPLSYETDLPVSFLLYSHVIIGLSHSFRPC